MSYEEELEQIDFDIDLEPEWMHRIGRIGRAVCFVPYVVYESVALLVIALIDKVHHC